MIMVTMTDIWETSSMVARTMTTDSMQSGEWSDSYSSITAQKWKASQYWQNSDKLCSEI